MNAFYEADEPVEKIMRDWMAAPKGHTAPLSDTYNVGILRLWLDNTRSKP